MSEVKVKPHYFELVMNSYSDGALNQEVVIVREYANTPGELCLKQMTFTKAATVKIAQTVVDAMDEMSKPIQELGAAELIAAMEEFGKGQGQDRGQGKFDR